MTSYRIALAEVHSCRNRITITCTVAIATCMRGIQSKRTFEILELSNNTAKRRIQDLSTDVEKQLMSRLKSSLLFHCHLTNQQTVRLAVLLVFGR